MNITSLPGYCVHIYVQANKFAYFLISQFFRIDFSDSKFLKMKLLKS